MILQMPPQTYCAKLFEVACDGGVFRIAGTLDGAVDLALPEGGTYVLAMETAQRLASALLDVTDDIRRNCLYDRDALLQP